MPRIARKDSGRPRVRRLHFPQPVRPPTESGVRYRALPCVMLVRVESPEVIRALERFNVQVLHVRQVIPAYERMRVTQPLLVLVGDSLRNEDVACLYERAVELDADVLQPHLIPPDELAQRLYEGFLTALRRRYNIGRQPARAKSA